MIRNLLKKYRELISYGFWGVATTLVNYAVYFACTRAADRDPVLANVIAWVVSVVFAFVVNKLLVFSSRSWQWGTAFRELWQFVSARLLSGALETGMVFVFVTLLEFRDWIVKIAAGVLVVILNYVLSKWIIFRRPKQDS